MRPIRRILTLPRALVAVLVLLAAFGLISGCAGTGGAGSGQTGSANASDTPPPVRRPPVVVLSSPETAVASYLNWISAAYRVGKSDVASLTFTPYEEVRVNSYVQYNIQEGRAIDQTLVRFDVRSVTTVDNTATVAASEAWEYRYISLKTKKYSSPLEKVSYDTTYTVVKGADGLWRVDRVEAKANGTVK